MYLGLPALGSKGLQIMVCLQKAFDGMKELAEKTGLEIFKKPIDEIEKIIEERK